MRHHHLFMISLTSVLVLAGCSSGSGLRSTGGTAAAAGGGAGASSVLISGGTQAPGGHASTLVSTSGGATSTAGVMTGGRAGGMVDSSTPVGGKTETGGSGTIAGALSATSGRGGASGGATASGSSPSRDAGAGDGGIVASGYCEGNAPKLTYQGQDVTPGVTDFRSSIAMDCCNGYGVNLHSTAALGFDVAVELILSISVFTPGEYEVGGSASIKARALVFKSSDPLTSVASVNSVGRLRVYGADASVGLTELGLCLEVIDTVSGLAGTRLYVPRVIIGSYQSDKRFQLFLLKDSTLRAGAVSSQALDSLVLEDSPILDLGRIAYVEKATSKMGFNPGQKYGESLRSKLGTVLDLPFVTVADGARIYLGSFTAPISSMAPTGPYVYVNEITADGLTIRAPVGGRPDPRNDERIIKALSERGKLVP